jgi:hypothetical protein
MRKSTLSRMVGATALGLAMMQPPPLAFGARTQIVGTQVRSPVGAAVAWRGINQGTWGKNNSVDAPAIKALGANHVRLLIRSNLGGPLQYETGVDAFDPTNTVSYFEATHAAQFLQEIDWAGASQLWSIVAYDTDQGQGVGRQTGTGWDFFDGSPEAAAAEEMFWKGWEWIALQCRGRPYILCYELLPEPLPYNSTSADAAPLREFFRRGIARIRAIDPYTPILIGPRASYGPNNIAEALLSERTDCIYTIDALTNKVASEGTIAALIEGFNSWCIANNVPGWIQQLGRNTSEDIGDVNADGTADTTENIGLTAMNGAMSLCNALGMPYTWWQYHQNTDSVGAYALYYKTVYPGPDTPDNWTPKTNEINSFAYHMGQNPAQLEAAAIAAATAAGGELFYVKSDLSNVWQTQDTSTPVTGIGQTVGRVGAVVGTTNLNQSTSTLRPTLIAGPNGYAMQFDGVDDWLALSNQTYFATGDNVSVIASGRAGAAAVNRVVFQCGNASSNLRYPFLAILATDEMSASWRGDDTTLVQANSVTLCDNRAFVATASLQGTEKKVFLNGVQEGSTLTTAVGSIAAGGITRCRFGANTNGGTNAFNGPMSLMYVGKTITDEQRRAISRWGAWLAGVPFRGAIPAA